MCAAFVLQSGRKNGINSYSLTANQVCRVGKNRNVMKILKIIENGYRKGQKFI